MPSIKIIKGTVDRLAHPPKGQKLFMDEALKGFGVLVGTNTKTYVAQRDIGGRTVRVSLLGETGKGAGLKLGRQYICLVCDLQMVTGASQLLRHGGEWMWHTIFSKKSGFLRICYILQWCRSQR